MEAREGIEARTGYSMQTVHKPWFGYKLWKLTYRCPKDYPIEGYKHLGFNFYWKVKEKDCV